MTRKPGQEEESLDAELKRLETALVTPLVPGELDRWVGEAQQAASAVQSALEKFTRDVLHAQYAEIGKSDPELLPRVEALIEEDRQLLADLQKVRAALAEIVTRLPEARKDEKLIQPELDQAEKVGTRFVVRVRKQMIAAGTWLDEALFRDRGPVD